MTGQKRGLADVRHRTATVCVSNSDYCAEGAVTDQLYNYGIPACLKWSHTKNLCTTMYKIWAWQINSGETISFMGTRINFRATRNNFWGGTKKIYGQPKNLRGATKIFEQLQKCSGTCIMFLGILNNYAGHIYNFRTLKKIKNGEWKYFWGNEIFFRINTNVYGLFPHMDRHKEETACWLKFSKMNTCNSS